MWAHRPVGRSMITLAIALVGATTLMLDAAQPAAGDSLLAWHAVSTLVLLGLALWALWAPRLPAPASSALTALSGLLLLGAFAVAAQRMPWATLNDLSTAMATALGLSAGLYAIGWRWARHEIRW
jgi:hypothetical protein